MALATEEMRKSTSAAEDAAKAAHASSDAAINAERPWIVSRATIQHDPRVEFIGGYDNKPREPRTFSYTLTFKNYGRTPARIVSVKAISYGLKQGGELPQNPPYIEGMKSGFSGDRMLVPNDSWEYSGEAMNATISSEQARDIESGKQTLVFLGRNRIQGRISARRSA
jgi:hypothetical protein